MPENDNSFEPLLGLRDLGISEAAVDEAEVRVRAVLGQRLDESRSSARSRRRGPVLRVSPGAVFVAVSVLVTLAIGLGALALLSHPRPPTRPITSATMPLNADAALDQILAPAYRPIDATVYEQDPQNETIQVDEGSAAGVHINDPVIGDGALVGRVTAAYRTTSAVRLITAPNFLVTAQVRNAHGDTGAVVPVLGRPAFLQLEDLRFSAKLTDGQEVVTAGFSSESLRSLYPAGIPIGHIVQAAGANLIGRGHALIAVTADLRGLRTVQILTPQRAVGRTVAPSSRSTPGPGSRVILAGDGLDAIRFGAGPGALRRRFERLLGSPIFGYQAIDECAIDHELVWPIVLNPRTGRAERSEELVLFFDHGRFVGYQYGGNGSTATGRERLRLYAATARGLTSGDSLLDGQRLYGHAFRISTAQGGSWRVQTAQGTVKGFAAGVPGPGNLGSVSIASIDAGNVGCPALSP
jgi:hypothetical protein